MFALPGFTTEFLFKIPGLTDVHRRRWTLTPEQAAEVLARPMVMVKAPDRVLGYVRYESESQRYVGYLRNPSGELIRLFEFLHPGDAVTMIRHASESRWFD